MKRKETIKDKKIFNNLIKNGHFQKNQYFVVYYMDKKEIPTNYGIAISKKVGNAVTRNKLKRQTRTIIDNHRNLFQNNNNYIIMIRKSCVDMNFHNLEIALIKLLEKIKVIK